MSHHSEGGNSGSGNGSGVSRPEFSQIVGSCPYVTVTMGGVQVKCLLDTGSMVSTVTESFFRTHFRESPRACQWLQLRAANGLDIPYLGYVELDVNVLGTLISKRGILIVKDHGSSAMVGVPGVLGMNIVRACYDDLFRQHGPALFHQPSVQQAPSIFQQALQSYHQVHTGDRGHYCGVAKDHLQRLDAVLTRLHHEGLKVKLEKCCFFKTQVRYLGHVISKDGVSTDPDKILAVEKWARPSTVSELRSFLGFASYYRRFVEGFSQIAAPLHRVVAELIKTPIKRTSGKLIGDAWTNNCERSFQDLKTKLVTAPVLAYADFSLPFILEIDASLSGLGAVLSQEQGGRVRPVAYASRALNRAEKNMPNYSSMKLELLGLKWAMSEKFREYLLGQKCIVWTDNNPLSHLGTAKLGATEQRWVAQLAAFDFSIKYRSGRSNTNADALSRQSQPAITPAALESALPGTSLPDDLQQSVVAPTVQVTQSAISALPHQPREQLVKLQQEDPMIGTFLSFWRQEKTPTHQERTALSQPVLELVRQWKRIQEQDGLLYRRIFRSDGGEEVLQLLLPTVLKEEVLQQLHQGHGHQGIERTTELYTLL
ncbi:uncharacterized protein LOC143114921 [Alosa pseudoharengus]|uniref:uncharacterized protein LOC143114921 n=1 Tax=Alosa pseudoharengus TaxID=34774 RepID=UPI003F8A6558